MGSQGQRTIAQFGAANRQPTFDVEYSEKADLLGRTLSIGGESENDLLCLLRLPTTFSGQSKILVAVHGISRYPLQQLVAFAEIAERNDAVLVAPAFSKADWFGYQRLGPDGGGPRCDMALIRAVDLIKRQLDLRSEKFFLFGFSGGGQFAHRFAFVHPERVEAVSIVSPGWFTMPDPETKYPIGLGAGGEILSKAIDPHLLLSLRYLVLVGDEDTELDRNLNLDPDIVAKQGTTRVERAERWTESMNMLGLAIGISGVVRLRLLPGIGHSFQRFLEGGGLCGHLEEFFFSE